MSTTVSYKGNTITTVNNNTKTLLTAGKLMEADVILTDSSGSGADVVIIQDVPNEYGTTAQILGETAPTGSINITTNGTHNVYDYAEAVVNVQSQGANLQTKSVSYTPSETAQSATVSPDSGYDGLSSVDVSVAAMPAGTAGTPTATKGTVDDAAVSVTPSVTNSAGYIQGGTKTGTAVTVTARELVAGNSMYADDSGSWDVANLETLIIEDGNVSNPVATKGTVSNHAISVTPSVTTAYGWIQGGTKTGTAVSVSASELVSGTLSVTQNGTADVTNYASVNVNVSGGGSSSWTKLGETTYSVSTSETTSASVGTVQCGSAASTKDKIIYVRIRDTAGPRAGYFLGSDSFFINYLKANGSTSTLSMGARIILRYTTSETYGETTTSSSTGYGVYAQSVSNGGGVAIYRRYHATNSLTVDGDYKVEVYALDYPDGISPFTI